MGLRYPIAGLAAALLLASRSCDEPPGPVGEEEYRVYAALIDSAFVAEGVREIVVSDSTLDLASVDDDLGHTESVRWLSGGGWRLARAFRSRNDRRYPLASGRLRAGAPVHLLSDTAFAAYPPRERWERFRTEHPGSRGRISLSRVAFNRDSSRAVVTTDVSCPLCGSGDTWMLERRAGRWRVIDSVMRWVS
jgi:hypothetical protein